MVSAAVSASIPSRKSRIRGVDDLRALDPACPGRWSTKLASGVRRVKRRSCRRPSRRQSGRCRCTGRGRIGSSGCARSRMSERRHRRSGPCRRGSTTPGRSRTVQTVPRPRPSGGPRPARGPAPGARRGRTGHRRGTTPPAACRRRSAAFDSPPDRSPAMAMVRACSGVGVGRRGAAWTGRPMAPATAAGSGRWRRAARTTIESRAISHPRRTRVTRRSAQLQSGVAR